MNDDDATVPMGTKASVKARELFQKYEAAESGFDRFLVLFRELRYTLALFTAWSVFMVWIGATVFG